jgi:hypothetical protein
MFDYKEETKKILDFNVLELPIKENNFVQFAWLLRLSKYQIFLLKHFLNSKVPGLSQIIFV